MNRTIFIFLMRAFCVIGIINCVSNFNENRILISIVIFLLVVLFLTISNQVVDIELNLGLIIENNGLRPVAITTVILSLYYNEDIVMNFISHVNVESRINNLISVSNLIVQTSSIASFLDLQFKSEKKVTNSEYGIFVKDYQTFHSIKANVKLNTGETFDCKVRIV